MQQDFNFTGEKTGEKSRKLNALRILRGLGSVQGFLRGFFLHFNCVSGVLVNSLQPHGLSLPGSSGRGIFQARILGWVSISFCRESSDPATEPMSLGSPASAGGFFNIAP